MASSSQNYLDEAFDDRFDEIFDQRFDQAFEKLVIGGDEDVRGRKRKKRLYIERKMEKGNERLWNNYFSETPTYPENYFRRRFE